MVGAVLKINYRSIGEPIGSGGILGSFFFLKPTLGVTVTHVLGRGSFIPAQGFSTCQLWLLYDANGVREIMPDDLTEIADRDLTFIQVPTIEPLVVTTHSQKLPSAGFRCHNLGYTFGTMPKLDAVWADDRIQLRGFSLETNTQLNKGHVKKIHTSSPPNGTLAIFNTGIETDYYGVTGVSGGPLYDSASGKIIGMITSGIKEKETGKENLFAISIRDIIDQNPFIS